jgi:hypothetical protein
VVAAGCITRKTKIKEQKKKRRKEENQVRGKEQKIKRAINCSFDLLLFLYDRRYVFSKKEEKSRRVKEEKRKRAKEQKSKTFSRLKSTRLARAWMRPFRPWKCRSAAAEKKKEEASDGAGILYGRYL